MIKDLVICGAFLLTTICSLFFIKCGHKNNTTEYYIETREDIEKPELDNIDNLKVVEND